MELALLLMQSSHGNLVEVLTLAILGRRSLDVGHKPVDVGVETILQHIALGRFEQVLVGLVRVRGGDNLVVLEVRAQYDRVLNLGVENFLELLIF